MSSNILDIYDALALTVITVNGVEVDVKDADELPNSVAAANLPVRLLTPLTPFGIDAGAISSVVNRGGSQPTVTDWTIADILLWSKVATSTGVKAHAKELIAYCAEYLGMLETLDASINVTGVVLIPDVINYPIQSADWFYGVRAVLTVKDKF